MNRRDIQELRVHVGHPAITLIMQCNKKRIKTKLVELVNQLESAEPLVTRLLSEFDVLYDQLACPVDGASIALFVNKYVARLYFLPFTMEEIATCGQTFKLDALGAALNRHKRYWVLDCSAGESKLFEGTEDFLISVDQACTGIDLPESSVGPLDTSTFAKASVDTRGVRKSNDFDCLEQDALPICLLGGAQDVQKYQESFAHRERIVAKVTTVPVVWLVMKEYFEQERKTLLNELHHGLEGADYVTRLQDILAASRQGNVSDLLVEDSYHFDACEDRVTRQVVTSNAFCPVGFQKISLVDQIIESVRSKGGKVILVPDGTLLEFRRLAALLRF